jgi:glutamate-ammonia-ligase adenylyltransferase
MPSQKDPGQHSRHAGSAARPEKLADDVRSMRARIEKEKGTKDIWDLKQVAGGLVDIEFIAQFLQLANADESRSVPRPRNRTGFGKLAGRRLFGRWRCRKPFGGLAALSPPNPGPALALSGKFVPADAPRGVLDLLLQASGSPAFERLEAELNEMQQGVRAIFERLVGPVEIIEAAPTSQ